MTPSVRLAVRLLSQLIDVRVAADRRDGDAGLGRQRGRARAADDLGGPRAELVAQQIDDPGRLGLAPVVAGVSQLAEHRLHPDRVSAATSPRPLSTFDTVGTETSAAAAIAAIVTRSGDPVMMSPSGRLARPTCPQPNGCGFRRESQVDTIVAGLARRPSRVPRRIAAAGDLRPSACWLLTLRRIGNVPRISSETIGELVLKSSGVSRRMLPPCMTAGVNITLHLDHPEDLCAFPWVP